MINPEKDLVILVLRIWFKILMECFSPKEASSLLASKSGAGCDCSLHICFINSSTDAGSGHSFDISSIFKEENFKKNEWFCDYKEERNGFYKRVF